MTRPQAEAPTTWAELAAWTGDLSTNRNSAGGGTWMPSSPMPWVNSRFESLPMDGQRLDP